MRRFWGGTSMPRAESNKTFSQTAILPASGRSSPERQSSNVDFPAPEGPNRMVIPGGASREDRKSTRLNSSHGYISYAVFCLKKKKRKQTERHVLTAATRDQLHQRHLHQLTVV